MSSALLEFTSKGICCPIAGVYIDPWIPVDRAIITHTHSDHAHPGSHHYLIHKDSVPVLKLRLGENVSYQAMEYGEKIIINGVRFSLHPAGHIIGSAQVRVEHKGEVWVVSGDYKLHDDHFCAPFSPQRCNSFITESTFGLPIYRWPAPDQVFNEIVAWWQQNQLEGKCSVIAGYALGKMQRIIRNVLSVQALQPESKVFAHGAVFNINERLREAGFSLPFIPYAGAADKKAVRNALILAPPLATRSSWLKRFEPYSLGFCSGWMAIRGAKNRRAVDRGFVLSDHADWNDLNSTVSETGAEKVFVTHGYTDVFSKWLNEKGVAAEEVKTMYGDEREEQTEGSEP
jgi:putative mRNA 3-end processing factor